MSRFKLKHILIVASVALVFFSTLLISFFTYRSFQKVLMEQFARSRVEVLRQISERISGTNDCITVLSNFYFNNLPFESLASDAEAFKEQHADFVEDRLRYLDSISQKTIDASGISCHYVLALNNGFSYCSQGNSEAYPLSEYQTKLWYSDIIRAKGQAVWISTYVNFAPTESRQYVYSLARSIQDPETDESVGIFLFNVLAPSIALAYDTKLENNNIYIVDQSGKIVSARNNDMLGIHFFHMESQENLLQGNEFCTIEKNRIPYLLSVCSNTDYNWLLVEEILMEDVLAPLEPIQRRIITIDITVLLVSLLIITCIAVNATRPLHELCMQLMRVGNSASTQPFTVHGCQEICEINEECNNMLSRIDTLIQNVRQKETSKRKLELSLLQAQINPHFVYNTLFTVKCLIDMENKEKALGLVDCFTAIMRSALSASDQFTSIQDEIDLLNQYCELQRYRYGDIFQFSVDCEESLRSCRILRMLLQPLVENAIFHGISHCDRPGQIELIVQKDCDDLQITVKDNGVGMKDESLDILLAAPVSAGKERSNFIGIRNIAERISLYFGSDYGLQVHSQPGIGTQIVLHLPLLYD